MTINIHMNTMINFASYAKFFSVFYLSFDYKNRIVFDKSESEREK